MSGEHLDLSSDPNPALPPETASRRFLGVHFACCGVYSRAYLNPEATEYVGRCPRCRAQARFVIGGDGHAGRFFSVRRT